jgi:hypothetical protein
MKKIPGICTLFMAGIFFLTACKKTSTEMINETIVTNPMDTTANSAMLKYSGRFMNGPYGSVLGQVKIYQQNGQYSLALEGFTSGNGPDLKVYLSKEMIPADFISLGSLRSTNGNQVYPITGMPDFTQFKFVLIHCEQYNHLFGSAELE